MSAELEPDRVRLFRFYTWLARPTSLTGLQIVLEQLRDVELLHIMKDLTNREALTIAWAEYGHRHSTATISVGMQSVDVLEVTVKDVRFGAHLGIT